MPTHRYPCPTVGFTYFLDDSGDSNLYGAGTHWVLGGILLPDASWPHLSKAIREIRGTWKIANDRELKWADLGTRISELTDARRRPNRELCVAHLKSVPDIRRLATEVVSAVAADVAIRVMGVVCVKRDALHICGGEGNFLAVNERCYLDMFHDAIERYEYFLTTRANANGAFGTVVIDQKSQHFDNAVRHTCADLLLHGTSYTKIGHVIDGVMVTPSHLSIGLQTADFVAGSIERYYQHCDERYMEILKDNFHRDWRGNVLGAGLKRYPTRPAFGSGPLTFAG